MPPKCPIASPKKGCCKNSPKSKGATSTASPRSPEPTGPIVFTEMSLKDMTKRLLEDSAGEVKAASRWPCVVDLQGSSASFLRHRDVNMLTTMDSNDMQPEAIRKALLCAIKFGKPFILDMMDVDMWEQVVGYVDQVQPGLMGKLLNKSILQEDVYFSLYKEGEDDAEQFKNKWDYKVNRFLFMILTTVESPNETMLRKMFPVRIV